MAMTIIHPTDFSAEADAAEAEDARLIERAQALAAQGVPTRGIRRSGLPHDEIVKLATEEKAGFIVLGTHGYGGISRVMLGSVADKVIRTAPCPVVTVRPKPPA